jgi:hypothetical protein
MKMKSLKALPIYSNKWCIVLQTDFYKYILFKSSMYDDNIKPFVSIFSTFQISYE